MQFDRAEFDHPSAGAACLNCGNGLRDSYYEVNGQTVCAACCETIRASAEHGTRSSRVIRAVGAGLAAAVGGSLLYWAILALTGYEFGLIAIVVGVAVGKAVNWGSRGKGGWPYQTMAIALTYLAMVSAYVPLLVTELRQSATEESRSSHDVAGPATESQAGVAKAGADDTPPTFLGAAVAIVMLLAFVCALPFLSGIENVLGIMILGFGLYEAWKLNRRTQLAITGPHAIAAVQST
jgi:hypothetical protein